MVWDTNQIKGYGNSFVILNMSCFFGVFSPGGKIDRDAFEQMQKAIHREGYDELGIHIDDSIAMGHLMLRVTTESVYDKQPLKSSCGRYLLVGHFRLDYRDELADKLGLTQQELELTPDSLLVMLAFKKWNQKCVDYLEGDWSFVLFDSNNKELFLAKDILGFSALFYTKFNENIYFSSAPFILTSVTSVFKELNFAEIQNVLYHGTRSPEGHTFFENHFAVTAGTYLLINNTLELYTIKYSILLSNQKVNYK
jgi:asparagine synthase (glutamine-hydrolysing)